MQYFIQRSSYLTVFLGNVAKRHGIVLLIKHFYCLEHVLLYSYRLSNTVMCTSTPKSIHTFACLLLVLGK